MTKQQPSTTPARQGLRWFDSLVAVMASGGALVLFLSPWIFLGPLERILRDMDAALPALTLLFLRAPWMPSLAALPLLGLVVVAVLGPGEMTTRRRRALLLAALSLALAAQALLGAAILAPFTVISAGVLP